MKQKNKPNAAGAVTIVVTGDRPELFFQHCTSHGIRIWDVMKTSNQACQGTISLKDAKYIKVLRRGMHYKIKFIDKKGFPFIIRRYLRKKELLIAFILSCLFLFILSNIVWDVKITGVPKDIEEKIGKQLEEYGIQPGSWIFSLDSPKQIQQQLLSDVPELLWVGIDQKGTTFHLEGVEKIVVKEEAKPKPRNLIAAKKGIIKKMYVSQGVPKVDVHDYVEKGDLLVSGKMTDEEESEEDEKKKIKYVAADGDITALTWYEVKVSVPLKTSSEQLTGNQEKKYHLGFGNFKMPVWGFGSPDFKNIQQEKEETKLRFLKWDLPVKIIETKLHEKTYKSVKRTKQEAIEAGITQAKEQLKLELGEASILSEKVLHETIENGKVKLNLYMSVEENIIATQPLRQGD
ncbi:MULTISPECIES: sporulation protein YqfD [Virgibacillus]|uniref:Stage IV sporulation protein n=1 Tax=Virgibacillus pantothenticus TaxID=1473 RepID=A0A0L0QPM0_VIRPA|nr:MULTISPECIES: sporulation protein YqfD [Virgibacillus]API90573.1 sporulation protein YqfD [Virgibacillus sp. 6R]KNE20527.1 hypothetical protein AFK71_19405 [Virgibacillus pantothenticus]MBS7429686.1 sporulation protein YqfD [Virgibacillus sp. 19R1-5]MBU8565561.1 sporulation protein YqfD [Virgibacillus pantothenticus]MBU8599859.1 sporulation protein YqfD [Virgibacillus pantothenticus]